MENRIAFLVSGGGGSLKTVLLAIERLQLPWYICLVLADRECEALRFAQRRGLPGEVVAYSRQNPVALQEALRQSQPDIVVTTFHKILDAATLSLLPGRFVNLHYSLLPAFKGYLGLETIEQARRLNAGIVGATCHVVTEEVDGGPILAQAALTADWRTETPAQVGNLVFRAAGLVLLEGIRQQLGTAPIGLTATTDYQGKKLLFAPPIAFNVTALNEDFWTEVKTM